MRAIYLNSWRGDWEAGPIRAVLDKLDTPPRAHPTLNDWAEALTKLNGCVLVFDQFDEYQIQHLDRFVPNRGEVISRPGLEEANSFFRLLNDAIRQGEIRCVFVTRKDVQWGRRSVCFEE
jgi:hypothetical protein